MVRYLETEGLTLINNYLERTYIGANGCSTIDLVFSTGKPEMQRILTNVIARKHIPVETTVKLLHTYKDNIRKETASHSRKIDLTAIENTDMTYLQQDIHAGNLDKAVTNLEKLIKDSTMDTAQQKRKKFMV